MDEAELRTWIREYVVQNRRLPSHIDYERENEVDLPDDIIVDWDRYLVDADVLNESRAGVVDTTDLVFFVLDYMASHESVPAMNELLDELDATQEQTDRLGEAYVSRFGGWRSALSAAGVDNRGRLEADDAMEMEWDMRRVRRLTGRETVTIAEYEEYGAYASATVIERFGVDGWEDVLDELGFQQSDRGNYLLTHTYSDEDLVNDLWRVYELQRDAGLADPVPRVDDIEGPDRLTEADYKTYRRRFGGIEEALEAAGISQD